MVLPDSRRWSLPGGRWLVLAAWLLAGCATQGGAPHSELDRIWSHYRELRAQRALAIAGELRHNRWVAGAAGGHATRAEAEAAALEECRERRARRRIVAACRIYAVGDEVTWPGV